MYRTCTVDFMRGFEVVVPKQIEKQTICLTENNNVIQGVF